MDFTSLIPDVSTLILVITSVAVLKLLPNVTRWGFSKVINWFSVDSIFQAGVIYPLKPEHEIKPRGAGVRSSLIHPLGIPVPKNYMKPGEMTDIYKQMQASRTATESNLEPESRFRVFGAIFGFFSGFFTKLFSFFHRK